MKKKTIVISIVLSLITGFVAIADGSQTPMLEELYKAKGDDVYQLEQDLKLQVNEWCKIERRLADSKLSDYSKKKADYTQSELDRLNKKSRQVCGDSLPAPETKIQEKKVAVDMNNYDLDCLADAVAVAETSYCQAGSGLSRNNAFGIMTWKTGTRQLKHYNTCEDSWDDFKRIWSTHYDVYPTMSTAVKWTGNDNPQRWLTNVNNAYQRCYIRKFGL